MCGPGLDNGDAMLRARRALQMENMTEDAFPPTPYRPRRLSDKEIEMMNAALRASCEFNYDLV